MATTNVPSITWANGAPVLPTAANVLAGVQADMNTAFGGGVNPQLSTPQGQMAQSEAAIIQDKNSQIALLANQVNPSLASGQWQDAIGAIYFISRIQAAGTVVIATCTGAVGTVIPAGSVAQDTAGYLYSSTAAATIGAGGSASVSFQNQTTGPIACASGALSKVYTAVNGWSGVTNASAGALGTNVESRTAFEARRQLSVAQNAINSVQAIQASLLQVPNVIDAYVVDNPNNTAISYGSTSYSIPANSILCSVAGGASSAITQAIWNKKAPGCGYAGNTSATVQDTTYNQPYPTYTVTYLTPTATPVYFVVQLKNISALPSNIIQLAQNAIIAAFTGTDGGLRARINQSITAGRFYAGLAAIDPNVQIQTLLMGLSSGSVTQTTLTFGIDQLPTIAASNITVQLV